MLLAGVVLASVAGCTSSASSPAPTTGTRTVVRTVTGTRPAPSFTPPPARAVAALPPGRNAPKGAKDRRCPYIRTGLNQDPTDAPNVADIEGNRIYRTVRLTTLQPIGCRFYFYAPPYEPTADILPRTFASPEQAQAAMVATAKAGKAASTYRGFAPGLTGISYRTAFDGGDNQDDWAFVFTKGRVMVVVHTSQPISANARYLAQAIAGKF